MSLELFRQMRRRKSKVPWFVFVIFAPVACFVGLMTFLHSGDVVMSCAREGGEARCTVTSTSLGLEISRQRLPRIQRAVIADSGGKHPNLYIELQLEGRPRHLEGTICGTGFGQRSACQAELEPLAEQINAFVEQPAQDSLRLEVAHDSRGGALMSGAFVAAGAVLLLVGLLRRRRNPGLRGE